MAETDFLKNPLIVALDMDDQNEVLRLAEGLRDHVGALKVGPRLVLRYGDGLLQKLSQMAPVFLDHKFLDIPNTMSHSVRAAFDCGVTMVTIHAWAGSQAIRELAVLEKELNKIRPFKILVVTILTSFSAETLPPPLEKFKIEAQVSDLSEWSRRHGLNSFVCSPQEVAILRKQDRDAFLVTPGIRWVPGQDDQSRTATPLQTLQQGASAFVVGRPVYQAKDPLEAARRIQEEIQPFLSARS